MITKKWNTITQLRSPPKISSIATKCNNENVYEHVAKQHGEHVKKRGAGKSDFVSTNNLHKQVRFVICNAEKCYRKLDTIAHLTCPGFVVDTLVTLLTHRCITPEAI